jgi:hypothetical protein
MPESQDTIAIAAGIVLFMAAQYHYRAANVKRKSKKLSLK